jgi:hypothetical protein
LNAKRRTKNIAVIFFKIACLEKVVQFKPKIVINKIFIFNSKQAFIAN